MKARHILIPGAAIAAALTFAGAASAHGHTETETCANGIHADGSNYGAATLTMTIGTQTYSVAFTGSYSHTIANPDKTQPEPWTIAVSKSSDGQGEFSIHGTLAACQAPATTTTTTTTTTQPEETTTSPATTTQPPATSASPSTSSEPGSSAAPVTTAPTADSTAATSTSTTTLAVAPSNSSTTAPEQTVVTGAGSYKCPPPGYPPTPSTCPGQQLPATGFPFAMIAIIGACWLGAGVLLLAAKARGYWGFGK